MFPTVGTFTFNNGTHDVTVVNNGTVLIPALRPNDVIQLKIDLPVGDDPSTGIEVIGEDSIEYYKCYEEVSGWEIMFWNFNPWDSYTVVLDNDGIGTICLLGGVLSECMEWSICPEVDEFDFLFEDWPCDDEVDPFDTYDVLLDWFGASLGWSGWM